MRLDFAKYTPMDSSDNIRSEHRGSHDIFVLTNGKNEPKGSKKISTKLSRVLIESFLKRPSLKDDAFIKITEMANNAVMAAQTPNFRIQCELLMMALLKNKVRWTRNGDITLLHFCDGKLVSRTEKTPSMELGEELNVEAELYETEILDNGDHFFVTFTKELEDSVTLQNIERSVRSADNAQDLLNDLLNQYVARGGSDDMSIFTLHLPPKQKKIPWIFLIILAALFVFFIIGALGKMRYGM